jgi:hypothetical protein
MEIIKYEMDEINQRISTKCPHGVEHLGKIIKVGSQTCNNCDHYHYGSFELKEIVCKYKDTIKKDYVLNKSAIRNMKRDLNVIKNDLLAISLNIKGMVNRVSEMTNNFKSLVEGE